MTGQDQAAETPQQPPPQNRPMMAALWMLFAVVSFSLMAIGGREISKELDTFQLMFFRSALGLLIVVLIVVFSGTGFSRFRTKRFKRHIVRNCFHFVGQFGWFFAVALIPLAQVFAIEFTTPLWVAIFSPLLLGEKLTKGRLLAVLIGFSGILIVVQPWQGQLDPGALAVVIAAIGFCFSMIVTKQLTSTESPLVIVFYMSLIQAPMGLIPALWVWVNPSMITMFWLVVISVFGLTAHYSIARAFAYADAIVVAPMDFLRLPVILVVGLLVYGEVVGPAILIGGAIILFGNWMNLWLETRQKKSN